MPDHRHRRRSPRQAPASPPRSAPRRWQLRSRASPPPHPHGGPRRGHRIAFRHQQAAISRGNRSQRLSEPHSPLLITSAERCDKPARFQALAIVLAGAPGKFVLLALVQRSAYSRANPGRRRVGVSRKSGKHRGAIDPRKLASRLVERGSRGGKIAHGRSRSVGQRQPRRLAIGTALAHQRAQVKRPAGLRPRSGLAFAAERLHTDGLGEAHECDALLRRQGEPIHQRIASRSARTLRPHAFDERLGAAADARERVLAEGYLRGELRYGFRLGPAIRGDDCAPQW